MIQITTKDDVKSIGNEDSIMPWCHDIKLDVEEGDKTIQAKNITSAIESAQSLWDEHITISVRKKDKNGLWYFGVVVIPITEIEPGYSVKIGASDDKIRKVILE